MFDKTAIIPAVLQKLKKLPVGHCIDLRTYKRNRSVVIVKKEEDKYLVVENGYFQEEFEVSFSKLKKLLKNLLTQLSEFRKFRNSKSEYRNPKQIRISNV